MLLGELVSVSTADGLELQGFYGPSEPRTEFALYYVHPWTANFYRVGIPRLIMPEVRGRGCSFLSLNTRGHDVQNQLYKREGLTRRFMRGGAAFERFEECILDVAAGLDWLEQRGHRQVVLLGYSMGATKCAYYLTERADARVIAAVWISPWDVYGFRPDPDRLIEAERQVAQGRGDTLLPFILETVVSARTYVNFRGSDARTKLFSFHLSDQGEQLGQLSVPVLVIMAEREELVPGNVDDFLQQLRERLVKAPQVNMHVVPGTDHLSVGGDARVARLVADWLHHVLPSQQVSLDP
jgi:pimeloyl-ACP methyl ester carboxylesterase